NLIIDFSSVIKPENQLQADQSVILSIIENGGQIENYLFGIRQPSASGALDVPAGVPSREFIYPPDSIRSFSQWFSKNASVWLNNVSDEFIYYNSPNPSDSIILTATESEIIRQLNTLYYSFLTVKEVLLITEDPNWIKL
ncbi:hypothetical protein KAR91_14685, partial [Candidatus Pacearchaeota archaeon]|nr:hypothetical protein [Candidatus Pacearchaeota archaeon]